MANILIVSQKELVSAPIFKQDQNVLELYNNLKDTNNIEILFLNKDMKKSNEEKKQGNIKQNELISNAKQVCIRDMMKDRLLKKNLNKFIEEHKIETIIFMSNNMAKLIMPYIESLLMKLNVICDLRLTNISFFLQQYKNEKEKEEPNFHILYKSFKIHFLQILPILKYTNQIILDEDCDTTLLKDQNIDNIILPKKINDYIKTNNDNREESYNFIEIIIDRNNYSSKSIDLKNNVQINGNNIRYIVNETKNFNLIDDINSIIKSNKFDYFVIRNNKIEILPSTIDLLIKYISFNDNHALSSPAILYSRERNKLRTYFDTQRFNNFSNWDESDPLLFSECVVIKRKFFNKIGLFDNNFRTFDYALFDFILRLYQIKSYYCRINDISVFKPMNISRQISLFKEDKNFLCKKWGESLFDMGI